MSLKEEWKQLVLAQALDYVDVSLSTLFSREKRLREIESEVASDELEKWNKEIEGEINGKG